MRVKSECKQNGGFSWQKVQKPIISERAAKPLKTQNQNQRGKRKRSKITMGSRLGSRVVHFPNLPIKLLMPTSFTNIREFALKTIPSASKIEIKRVLESLYGFEIDKVRTLNMDGKKKKRGGLLLSKPNYKKAYVTLKSPLSLNSGLFPIGAVEEEAKQKMGKKGGKSSVVEEGEGKKHWLDGREKQEKRFQRGPPVFGEGKEKFPWSHMRFR